SPSSKDAVRCLSEYAQKKDRKNNQQIRQYISLVYQEIGYSSRDQVIYSDFIPYVEDILLDQLNDNYRLTHMLHTEEVTRENLDFSRYELFIKVYARYLSTLVGPEGE